MHHPDQIERYRYKTTTPFEKMYAELLRTPKWHVVKRKRLERRLATIEFVVSNTVR